MRKSMPFVVGFLVAAVVSGGLSFLAAAAHSPVSAVTYLPGTVFGMVTAMALVSLGANRKVALADPAQQQSALAMVAPPERSLIYLYRKSITGKALGVDITLDGSLVTQIRSGRFTCLSVLPGSHRLTASFGKVVMARGTPLSVEIAATPGSVHAFRIDNVMGLANARLKAVPMLDLNVARQAMAPMRMVIADMPSGEATWPSA